MDRRAFLQTGAGALAGLWLPGCSREPSKETIVFRNGVVLPVDGGWSVAGASAAALAMSQHVGGA